jgi:hypothetical protein
VVSRLVPAERFLPKGSYRNVPAKKVPAKKAPETQRFLPKGSCQKGSYQKGSWKYSSWAIRFLPKGSCQQDSQVHMVPVKNIPRSIWFLSKIFPGPYGSCQKHSQVHMVPVQNISRSIYGCISVPGDKYIISYHMVPRFKFLIFNF